MGRSACLAALCVCILLAAGIAPAADWDTLRARMVERQIKARGVDDPAVLAAMRKVPRHLFVPEKMRQMAYGDHPLPIGLGQTISQPLVVARMSSLLELRPGDKVLEIGTGSGYQAAVLAEMGALVYSIEIVPELAQRAARVLGETGYERVRLKLGDGYKGWPGNAPFDAVIVTAAPPEIPEALVGQLKRGGRLAAPVGPAGAIQRLILLKKNLDGTISRKTMDPVRFVPMIRGRKNGGMD